MATKKSTAVAKKEESTAVAESGGFEEFAGAGMEEVGAQDLLIPRLAIIQALSPQLNKSKSEYIEGAEQNQICDVGMGEIFQDGVLFLPVHYSKVYLEWAPRATQKGLVQIHTDASILDQTTRNDRNQPILANGNLIQETAQFFGLNLTAGGRHTFIPMSSTQLKKARKWLTLATGERLKRANGQEFTPPLFYRTYHLGVSNESNAEGSWGGWSVERGPALPELGEGFDWRAIKEKAVAFRDSLSSGDMKADLASMDEESRANNAKSLNDQAM
jgi:hypothetical protein